MAEQMHCGGNALESFRLSASGRICVPKGEQQLRCLKAVASTPWRKTCSLLCWTAGVSVRRRRRWELPDSCSSLWPTRQQHCAVHQHGVAGHGGPLRL